MFNIFRKLKNFIHELDQEDIERQQTYERMSVRLEHLYAVMREENERLEKEES